MRLLRQISISLFLLSLFANCYGFPQIRENTTFVVSKDYDLRGKTLIIPKGVTLKFDSGTIKNGIIVGTDTKISGRNFHIFDNVDVTGSWLVPSISSNMFYDLTNDNALRKVMSLANKKIKNTVTIEQGVYNFSFKRNQETGLLVEDNTTLEIKGVITITPNSFVNYQIIRVHGDNIVVKGRGILMGDRDNHIGEKGEWGMGIDVSQASNVQIKDLTIRDCWGDCVYIGKKSNNITVDNCNLYGSRRQGISVTDAMNITIKNCQIYNIFGTLPGFAIDVEPNKNCKVENVVIENVTMSNCIGGVQLNGHAERSLVKNITVKNCMIYNMDERYLVKCFDCQGISFEACGIDETANYILFKDCINASKKNITEYK